MADEKICPLQLAGLLVNWSHDAGIVSKASTQLSIIKCLKEKCQWWTDYIDFKDCALVSIAKTLQLKLYRREPNDK